MSRYMSAHTRNNKVSLEEIFRTSNTRECRLCKGSLADGRKNWCSPKCKRLAYTVKYALNWRIVREKVLERDNYECVKCGSSESLHVDHVIPVSKNGAMYDEENLQVLCRECNLSKSDIVEFSYDDPHKDFKNMDRRVSISKYVPEWI